MKVALFIPCYVDQLYPQVGMATVRVLERLGVEPHFPEGQTCCGQPMANSGAAADAVPLARRYVEVFAGYDYVVSPSGSCASMVRKHYDELIPGEKGLEGVKRATMELCEFITDVLKVERLQGRFARRVGLHRSCHGLRELWLGSSSERMTAPRYDKVAGLLGSLEGIQLVELSRPDECCGFGGTFSVDEEAVSSMMGRDRIADHLKAGAELVTGTDVSCLMHMDGLARRMKQPVRFQHIAEVFEEATR